jgi:hypothetical protein
MSASLRFRILMRYMRIGGEIIELSGWSFVVGAPSPL